MVQFIRKQRVSVLILIIGILIAFSQSFAQDKNDEATTRTKNRYDSLWAIQFQINNNFTLGTFQGSFLSVLRRISPTSAWRLGIGLGFTTNDNDQNNHQVPDTTYRYSDNHTNSSQNIYVVFHYVKYFNIEGEVNVYMGIGPAVNFSNHRDDVENNTFKDSLLSGQKTITDSHSSSIGANGSFGVEWYATRSISLVAEYGATLNYTWGSSSSNQTYLHYDPAIHSESTSHSFNLTSMGVKFGLSAYFTL